MRCFSASGCLPRRRSIVPRRCLPMKGRAPVLQRVFSACFSFEMPNRYSPDQPVRTIGIRKTCRADARSTSVCMGNDNADQRLLWSAMCYGRTWPVPAFNGTKLLTKSGTEWEINSRLKQLKGFSLFYTLVPRPSPLVPRPRPSTLGGLHR